MIYIILSFVTAILQLGAAYYSYMLYRNLGGKAWLLLAFSMLLLMARRFTLLEIRIGLVPSFHFYLDYIEKFILPLLIGVFLFMGFFLFYKEMKKNKF